MTRLQDFYEHCKQKAMEDSCLIVDIIANMDTLPDWLLISSNARENYIEDIEENTSIGIDY